MGKDLIQLNRDTVEDKFQELQEQLSTKISEKGKIEGEIAQIKANMEWTKSLLDSAKNGSGKRKKGEIEKQILSLFSGTPGEELTASEIARRTGLPFSSVRNVLTRTGSKFEASANDMWRLKK